jgi:hypothetical protein
LQSNIAKLRKGIRKVPAICHLEYLKRWILKNGRIRLVRLEKPETAAGSRRTSWSGWTGPSGQSGWTSPAAQFSQSSWSDRPARLLVHFLHCSWNASRQWDITPLLALTRKIEVMHLFSLID